MTDKELKRLAFLIAKELQGQPLRQFCTPRQVARQLGVSSMKVIGWIRRGELQAVNVATNSIGRARWRILPDSLSDFLKRRQSVSEPKRISRRRAMSNDLHGPTENQSEGPRLAKGGLATQVGRVWYHRKDGVPTLWCAGLGSGL